MSNTIDEPTVQRTEDEGVPLFKTSPNSDQYDIICAGFGPSALAIAIAMHERGFSGKKILFLEQQSEFGWHTGMLLPGAKMQISFMKDLATMRNPRSYFTFTNYLHHHGRLAHFINLSTFTPFREEFNHYMKWCASHFKDWVRYNQKVVRVTVGPLTSNNAVGRFQVITRNIESGELGHLFASHVIVATGGEVAIPKGLAQDHLGGRVIHSSQYLKAISKILANEAHPYRVAVVGGGQSAVEIVENLKSRYRQTHIRLFFRDTALRPSDDSPFVNEIFDPESVDKFFSLDTVSRQQSLHKNKATNYSVVRTPLLDGLYEELYRQRLLQPNPYDWALRLIGNTEVCGVEECAHDLPASGSENCGRIQLRLKNVQTGQVEMSTDLFDAVVLATGYRRNPLDGILEDLKPLISYAQNQEFDYVQRNYRLRFRPGAVRRDAGVWLQGSCEDTHGISDTLLSILAVRADEILSSILASERETDSRVRL